MVKLLSSVSQKGFAPIVIIVALGLFVFGGVMFWNKSREHGLPPVFRGEDHMDGQFQAGDWPTLWRTESNKCQQDGPKKFSALPVDISDITVIEPMGELRESHIIPGDHVGIEYTTSPTSTPVKVFAPADGVIVNIERHPYTPEGSYPKNIRHYHFYIVHSCSLFSGFVHLTDFTAEILEKSPELKKLHESSVKEYTNLRVNIPVKSGQQIGTAWSFGLLGIVAVDLNHTNEGYLNPGSFRSSENWRLHDISLFDYLEENLKSQVMAKNPRTKEPRGGKIDFDIKGKAVGSWFEKGTGGFRDDTKKPELCGNFPCPYWDGHLALVYDFVEPEKLRVSIGRDFGLSDRTPFGVKGNGPDFAQVGAEEGIVKYELVGLKDVTSQKGYSSHSILFSENNETQVLGTMLVQVLNDGLKMEIFPGKIKDQVSGFTNRAVLYER